MPSNKAFRELKRNERNAERDYDLAKLWIKCGIIVVLFSIGLMASSVFTADPGQSGFLLGGVMLGVIGIVGTAIAIGNWTNESRYLQLKKDMVSDYLEDNPGTDWM
jgi:Na+/melibiose symporter-like transporter